jgi:YidC/Oxa1 family membrane protein insertase
VDQQNQIFDRRTLLAFALMFLVWFGWASYFSPKKGERAADLANDAMSTQELVNDRPDEGQVTRPADPTPPPTISAPESADDIGLEGSVAATSGWLDRSDDALGTPISIRTPLYVAEIDPVGGDIRSWQLLRYDDASGAPVNLVPTETTDPSGQRAHSLRIMYEDRVLDLSHVNFETTGGDIALGESQPTASIVLRGRHSNGASVILSYFFDYERYSFDVDARIVSPAGASTPLNLHVAWPAGLARTEPDSVSEARERHLVCRVGEDIEKVKFSDLASNSADKGYKSFHRSISWVAAQGKYFVALVLPKDQRVGQVELGGDKLRRIQSFDAGLALEGGRESTVSYTVFMGPVDYDILKLYDGDPYNSDVSKLVNFGPAILRPIAAITFSGLKLLQKVIPNWGWAIILFSALTKVLFYPLTKSSTKSMKKMQEIQPLMKELKEKHKDDQQAQSQEMMRLYKEHGVNPVGGCLPMVVQMPVFYALYRILLHVVDLRQAPWAFWVDDLSRPDSLFQLPFTLPFLGDQFALLPVLMAVGMWAQTKISQSGTAPAEGAMAQQAKMMGTFMPIMMLVIFYNSPSGLVLYWLVNTVLTAAQTWWIHRRATPIAVAAS